MGLLAIIRLTLLHAVNKGKDQPAHPRSLVSAFVVCSLESTIANFKTFYMQNVKILASL